MHGSKRHIQVTAPCAATNGTRPRRAVMMIVDFMFREMELIVVEVAVDGGRGSEERR